MKLSLEDEIRALIPDAIVVSTGLLVVTISSTASGKAIFDAEAKLRHRTGEQWEIMMGFMEDKNKLRIKLMNTRPA